MNERLIVWLTGGQEVVLDVDPGNGEKVRSALLTGTPGPVVVSWAGQPSITIVREHVVAVKGPWTIGGAA